MIKMICGSSYVRKIGVEKIIKDKVQESRKKWQARNTKCISHCHFFC